MTPVPPDPRPGPADAAGPAPAAGEDDYQLQAAASSAVPDARRQAVRARIEEKRRIDQALEAMSHAPEAVRFSVRDLLLIMTFAASLWAVFRLVRLDLYALALGGLTFVSLVVLSLCKRKHAILNVGWWVLLTVYLTCALAAIVLG